MKRFLTIENNKLISERFAQEIVDGEIEETSEFDGVEVGMIFLDGVWQYDPVEIAEQQNQQRISELEQAIDRGLKVGYDISEFQAELKSLYTNTHDEYILQKQQPAIDEYTLSLIEMGVL